MGLYEGLKGRALPQKWLKNLMDKDSNDWDVVVRMYSDNGYGTRLHSKWFSDEWFRMFRVPEGETKFLIITLQGNYVQQPLSKPQSLWSLNYTITEYCGVKLLVSNFKGREYLEDQFVDEYQSTYWIIVMWKFRLDLRNSGSGIIPGLD